MADLILVNSRFTASTFAKTFKHLHARGIRPSVLYPAVNVDQFEKPTTNKLRETIFISWHLLVLGLIKNELFFMHLSPNPKSL